MGPLQKANRGPQIMGAAMVSAITLLVSAVACRYFQKRFFEYALLQVGGSLGIGAATLLLLNPSKKPAPPPVHLKTRKKAKPYVQKAITNNNLKQAMTHLKNVAPPEGEVFKLPSGGFEAWAPDDPSNYGWAFLLDRHEFRCPGGSVSASEIVTHMTEEQTALLDEYSLFLLTSYCNPTVAPLNTLPAGRRMLRESAIHFPRKWHEEGTLALAYKNLLTSKSEAEALKDDALLLCSQLDLGEDQHKLISDEQAHREWTEQTVTELQKHYSKTLIDHCRFEHAGSPFLPLRIALNLSIKNKDLRTVLRKNLFSQDFQEWQHTTWCVNDLKEILSSGEKTRQVKYFFYLKDKDGETMDGYMWFRYLIESIPLSLPDYMTEKFVGKSNWQQLQYLSQPPPKDCKDVHLEVCLRWAKDAWPEERELRQAILTRINSESLQNTQFKNKNIFLSEHPNFSLPTGTTWQNGQLALLAND